MVQSNNPLDDLNTIELMQITKAKTGKTKRLTAHFNLLHIIYE
jgi:hypothetical protein